MVPIKKMPIFQCFTQIRVQKQLVFVKFGHTKKILFINLYRIIH